MPDFLRNTEILRLKGVLNTPEIWKPEQAIFPLFRIEKANLPGNLPIPEIPGNPILGKRVEYYFRFILQNYSEEEILLFQKQILRGKITLGELDFLLKNKITGKISHVELVYKFYLFEPKSNEWIGPNRNDSLSKKINRLKDHQFPLLFSAEGKDLLKNLNIDPDNVEQKISFKSQLFLPFGFDTSEISGVNHDCISGFWLRKADFGKFDSRNNLFYSPRKTDWLIDPEENNSWYSFKQIVPKVEELLKNKKSPLLWMKDIHGRYTIFFLVWW